MCLGVPGEIIEITNTDPILRSGRVNFGGIVKEINLAYVPGAVVGDYVVVHVGFAISAIDKEEAQQVFRYLGQIGELAELGPGESGLLDPLQSHDPQSFNRSADDEVH